MYACVHVQVEKMSSVMVEYMKDGKRVVYFTESIYSFGNFLQV